MWIFAPFFPIISDSIYDVLISDIFLLLNAIFASIATIFIVFGLFAYFMKISKNVLIILIIIVIFIPILTSLILGITNAIKLALLFHNLAYILAFIGPLFRLKSFKKQVGKSIRWYYGVLLSFFTYLPISFIIFLQGFSYGLYDVNNEFVIILNYIPSIATTILIVIFLIHIEYNNSTFLKNKLKDQYSHDLGNILQVLLSTTDLLKLKEAVEEDERDYIDLLKKKCKEASKLISEIRKLE